MDSDAQFTGKYESSGRAATMLVDAFYQAVAELLVPVVAEGGTVLEVGCGAGYSSERIATWLPGDTRFVASELGDTLARKSALLNPSLPHVRQSVYELAFPDRSVDVVVMLEVLEHLDDPVKALAELRRVARGHVVLSTPREPIWRVLNMCRGKYWRALGNTPGHIQHWSSRGLRRLVARDFEVVDMRRPLPWTVLLLKPRL